MARVFAILDSRDFPDGAEEGARLHVNPNEWGPFYHAVRADDQNPANGIAQEPLSRFECLWDSVTGEVWDRKPINLTTSASGGVSTFLFETYADAAKEALSQIEERRGTPSYIGNPSAPVWQSAGFTRRSMLKLHRMAAGEFDND